MGIRSALQKYIWREFSELREIVTKRALDKMGRARPFAKLSAASLPFGSVTVGQTKTMAVTLTNFGTSAMSIVSPGIVITGTAAADYSQTNTCGSSVAGGSNCTITGTFKHRRRGYEARL